MWSGKELGDVAGGVIDEVLEDAVGCACDSKVFGVFEDLDPGVGPGGGNALPISISHGLFRHG